MKKFTIFLLVSVIFIASFVFPVNAQDDNYADTGLNASTAFIPGQIVSNATSAIVYEINSETLMVAQNIDEKIYPASLVKIMTALLAIENGNLDGIATVTQEAVSSTYGSTSAGLRVGEQLTVRELLYCMLTGSANDAASVIAIHIGGTTEAFVAMMNSRARELGCVSTNFTDPHGISSKNQYSTARDMARIFAAAYESEAFREIISAVKHTVPATALSPERELTTGNYSQDKSAQRYYDSRVTGGRTGVAADRSRILGVFAESGNMSAIAIVFGARSKFAADNYTVEQYGSFKEISNLLDATISSYKIAQIFYKGQIVAQRHVINGENDLALMAADIQTVIVPNELNIDSITYRFTDSGVTYTAPIAQGSAQGSVEIFYGGQLLASVQLVAGNDVSVACTKLIDLQKTGGSGFGFFIVICVLLIILLVFLVHRRQVAVRRKKLERRRRERRRK